MGDPVPLYSVGVGPWGIAIDASGNVWVTNSGSNNVTELNSSGTTIGTFTVGKFPEGIAIDSSGNVWVTGALYGGYFLSSSSEYGILTELSPTGTIIGTDFVGYNTPPGIAIDPAGNIWVTNSLSNTVTEIFGIATGPQYFPYTGPVFPGGGNL